MGRSSPTPRRAPTWSSLLRQVAQAACGLVVLLLGAAGCGSYGHVKGKVYYQDKPLTGGTVVFVPDGGGQSVPATIDEQGNYTIDKIAAGPVKIAVDSGPPQAPKNPMRKNPMAGKMAPPKDAPVPEGVEASKLYNTRPGATGSVAIPDKYKDYQTSGETYTVQPGDQEHEIRLK
jgi:hypothetical protein